MESKQMLYYFNQLQNQREQFYHDDKLDFEAAWKRPSHEKWSLGETLYHLTLMTRLFRRFARFYVPIMLPLAHLQKNKPYHMETHDIYKEYKNKKKKAMSAPFLIKPPANLEGKWTFSEVQLLLQRETDRLASNLHDIKQDLAGQIYFPDPIAGNPNLIQCIHLLAIHEKHHFDLTKKYYLI